MLITRLQQFITDYNVVYVNNLIVSSFSSIFDMHFL